MFNELPYDYSLDFTVFGEADKKSDMQNFLEKKAFFDSFIKGTYSIGNLKELKVISDTDLGAYPTTQLAVLLGKLPNIVNLGISL